MNISYMTDQSRLQFVLLAADIAYVVCVHSSNVDFQVTLFIAFELAIVAGIHRAHMVL